MRTSAIKIILLSIFLQSCSAVNYVFVEDRQKPGPDSNAAGIVGISKPTGNNLEDVKPRMASNCADWGGLNESSIYTIPNLRGGKLFTDYWGYKCNGLGGSQPKASVTQPSQSPLNNKIDIEAGKQKCSDLGFKVGTEGFGKCVLQLSK